MSKINYWLLLGLHIILLSGCATYREDIDDGLILAKQGEWQAAEAPLRDALDNSQDKLLYYLEIGTLAQNQGDYQRSNQLLEQAERLSDTFLQESLTNRSWALLSNPRQSNYRGNGIERVYISYLKSLNYLALSEKATSRQARQQLLDAALVEVRRIDIKLNEIAAQTPSYQELDAQKNSAFYEKAMRWLSSFYTGRLNRDNFLYRDDAWARYMTGLQYEISGEYDDARISYQKSAELYEAGYAKQYELSPMTAERAWLDTIRMMQKGGFSSAEIDSAIQQHLSASMQKVLKTYQDKDAELVILEHQGFMPDKSELSLSLYADPLSTSLVLEPLHGGGRMEDNDAFRWFTMVYADINPLNMIANYKVGGAWNAFSGVFTKRVILGSGVWGQLKQAKIDEMLTSQAIRVTVPYYRRFTLDSHPTKLVFPQHSSLQSFDSLRMTSLADIAFQDQLANAQRDIYESMIREFIRTWLAYRVSSEIQDDSASLLLNLIGQVTVVASSAADTRNWLTLPAQVRLTRQALSAGEYSPEYETNGKSFTLGKTQLKNNEIKVWNLRNPY
ncbi:hypothetical protein [Marinomonas sp. THO17]|uniref:hypothetical protein n=1 Tax=Marinomonas sp. THO17 TaxID=3149048 RepID=UPI00336C1EBC